MEVILLEKIRNLGSLGQQVKVKPGFARNYLIPYGKAVVASPENKQRFEARRAELEKAQADALDRARSRASGIEGATLQIVRKLAGEGKIYGSVGTKEISDAARQNGIDVAKSEIHLSHGPLKDIGDHEVTVVLHPEVSAKLIVSVVGEE